MATDSICCELPRRTARPGRGGSRAASGRALSNVLDQLVLRVAWRARERNGVAHVTEARHVGDGALEAQAETGVRHAAVAAQVPIPAEAFFVDSHFFHARVQPVDALLALAAADD